MSWKMGKNQNIPGGSEEKYEEHIRISGILI
jgi:hypothetical protein